MCVILNSAVRIHPSIFINGAIGMHWGNVDKTLNWQIEWRVFSRESHHQPK